MIVGSTVQLWTHLRWIPKRPIKTPVGGWLDYCICISLASPYWDKLTQFIHWNSEDCWPHGCLSKMVAGVTELEYMMLQKNKQTCWCSVSCSMIFTHFYLFLSNLITQDVLCDVFWRHTMTPDIPGVIFSYSVFSRTSQDVWYYQVQTAPEFFLTSTSAPLQVNLRTLKLLPTSLPYHCWIFNLLHLPLHF